MKTELRRVSLVLLLCACSAPKTAGVKPVEEASSEEASQAEASQAEALPKTPVLNGVIRGSDLGGWPFVPESEEGEPVGFGPSLPRTDAVVELLKSPLPDIPLTSSFLGAVTDIAVSYSLADCANLAGQTIDVPYRVARDLTAFVCPAGSGCNISEEDATDPNDQGPDGETLSKRVKKVEFPTTLPVYRISGTTVEAQELSGLTQTVGDSICGGSETDAEFLPGPLTIEKKDLFIASARALEPSVQEASISLENFQVSLARPNLNGNSGPLDPLDYAASYKLVDLNADEVPDLYVGNFQAGDYDGVLIALNINKAWVMTHLWGPSKECDPDC
jgi:hypothetical protein